MPPPKSEASKPASKFLNENPFFPPAQHSSSSGSIGCEMHPVSETIKEDKEHAHEKAVEQKKSFEPEAANPNAPSYFKTTRPEAPRCGERGR